MLQSPHTAVFSSWLRLGKISSTLGAAKTKESFLDPVTKHAKLYHRSFLMTLINRFKQTLFLKKITKWRQWVGTKTWTGHVRRTDKR